MRKTVVAFFIWLISFSISASNLQAAFSQSPAPSGSINDFYVMLIIIMALIGIAISTLFIYTRRKRENP